MNDYYCATRFEPARFNATHSSDHGAYLPRTGLYIRRCPEAADSALALGLTRAAAFVGVPVQLLGRSAVLRHGADYDFEVAITAGKGTIGEADFWQRLQMKAFMSWLLGDWSIRRTNYPDIHAMADLRDWPCHSGKPVSIAFVTPERFLEDWEGYNRACSDPERFTTIRDQFGKLAAYQEFGIPLNCIQPRRPDGLVYPADVEDGLYALFFSNVIDIHGLVDLL